MSGLQMEERKRFASRMMLKFCILSGCSTNRDTFLSGYLMSFLHEDKTF